MSKRYPDTKPIYNDPYAKAVADCGGILFKLRIRPIAPPDNNGCGCDINVVGTNGGLLRCGSLLTMFGVTKPYYCGNCEGN